MTTINDVVMEYASDETCIEHNPKWIRRENPRHKLIPQMIGMYQYILSESEKITYPFFASIVRILDVLDNKWKYESLIGHDVNRFTSLKEAKQYCELVYNKEHEVSS